MGGMNIRKISCDILNRGVLAIIYDHIGRRSQVLFSRLERARYICGVRNVDLDWECLAVRHIHSGTRSDCDFEVVLHELESNGLWVRCGVSVPLSFSKKFLGNSPTFPTRLPAPRMRATDIAAEQRLENLTRCNEGCGWRDGRVQGFESTKAWDRVLHLGSRRWYKALEER